MKEDIHYKVWLVFVVLCIVNYTLIYGSGFCDTVLFRTIWIPFKSRILWIISINTLVVLVLIASAYDSLPRPESFQPLSHEAIQNLSEVYHKDNLIVNNIEVRGEAVIHDLDVTDKATIKSLETAELKSDKLDLESGLINNAAIKDLNATNTTGVSANIDVIHSKNIDTKKLNTNEPLFNGNNVHDLYVPYGTYLFGVPHDATDKCMQSNGGHSSCRDKNGAFNKNIRFKLHRS